MTAKTYYLLCHRENGLTISIAGQRGIIKRLLWESLTKKEWSYVETKDLCSVFESQAEAGACQDMYCRFAWIHVREMSDLEKALHNLEVADTLFL